MVRASSSHSDQLMLHDPVFSFEQHLDEVRSLVKLFRSNGADESRLRQLALGTVFLFGSGNTEALTATQPSAALTAIAKALTPEYPLDLPASNPTNDSIAGQLLVQIRNLVAAAGAARAFSEILAMFPRGEDGFHTPPALAALLARLVDIHPDDRVYDPISTTGELLVAAAHSIAPHTKKITLIGSTPGTTGTLLTRMNLTLNALEAQLDSDAIGNLSTAWTPGDNPQRILANPAFNRTIHGLSARKWAYAAPPGEKSNYAWLQHILECLPTDGRAAVLMANVALASSSDRTIRQRMVEDGLVEGVIALARGTVASSTSIPTSIWLLHRPSQKPSSMLFVDASETPHSTKRLTAHDLAAIGDIVATWRTEGHLKGHAVPASTASLSQVGEEDFDLTPARYIVRIPRTPRLDLQHIDRLRNQLQNDDPIVKRVMAPSEQTLREVDLLRFADITKWTSVKLCEICEISSGVDAKEVDGGSIAIVKPRDLRLNRIFEPQSWTNPSNTNHARVSLADGDILCTRTGTVGRIALTTVENAGWLCNSGLLRIRIKPGVPVLATFLTAFLSHPHVQDWIQRHTSGTAAPGITATTLRRLPIELPSPSDQRVIGEAADQLLNYARAHQRVLLRSEDLHRETLAAMFGGYERPDAAIRPTG